MRKLLLLFVFTILPLAASADAVEINGIYYNLDNETLTAEVTYNPTKHADYSGEVSIPETVIYNGVTYTVTSIGESAFEECTDLTSISIPNTVTRIESMAFFYTGLTSVTINSSVTFIGDEAFSECENLKKVIIPDLSSWCSVTLESHTASPFNGGRDLYSDENTKITDLVIPSDVTSICDYAFASCKGLVSVTIPASVRSIGIEAFYSDYFSICDITSVTIESDELSIAEYAFDNCSSVTDVYCYTESNNMDWDGDGFGNNTKFHVVDKTAYKTKFPQTKCKIVDFPLIRDGINYIITDKTAHVVAGTERYEGDIEIASSVSLNNISYDVVAIEKEAFQDCVNMTSVIIPNSVISIDGWAFEYCPSLASITIPNSVKYIGEAAFADCNYSSVTIGSGVISIGEDAFSGCHNLEKVIVQDIGAWCSINFENEESNPLYKDYDLVRHLYSDENTEITDLIIPSNVTAISNYAFNSCESLLSVTIPNSVKSIGEKAFKDCTGLLSVTIYADELIISSTAFDNCYHVTDVYCYTESNNMDWDGDGFGNNTKFHVVDKTAYKAKYPQTSFDIVDFSLISGGINYIITDKTAHVVAGTERYEGDIEIASSVSLNNISYDVVAIEKEAFFGCSGLTSVIIPASVTSIEFQAFGECSGLTSMEIPNSVTSLGGWAFIDCSRMSSILLSNGLTSIGDGIFTGCYRLTDINIPEGVTSIGEGAFDGCTGLTSITLPNSLRTIGVGAFIVCEGLTSIEIPDGLISIECNAFRECSGLTSITIPNSVTSIGSGAFEDCTSLQTVVINADQISFESYSFDDTVSDVYCYTESNDLEWDGTGFGDETKFHVFDKAAYEEKFPDACVEFTSVFQFLGINYDIVSATDKTAQLIASENGYEGDIEIPTSIAINDVVFSVIGIGDRAFFDCDNLTSVVIPNSVTSIGISAFEGCNQPLTITIGNGVTFIGSDAFASCDLEKVLVSDISSWCSIYFENEGSTPFCNAFNIYSDENTIITNLEIPSGVTTISDYAFSGCLNFTSVTIPSSVTSIGSDAFANFGIDKVIVPSISAWCSINFENEDSNPLYRANHLYSNENTEITELIIPSNVTSISSLAFLKCEGLNTVTICAEEISIGEDAFKYCTSITDASCFTEPEKMTWTGRFFPNSTVLFHVLDKSTYENKFPNAGVTFDDALLTICTDGITYKIISTTDKLAQVVSGDKNHEGALVIPASISLKNNVDYSVVSVGDEAFSQCEDITSVVIPNSVTTIGDDAFAGCEKMTSISLSSNLTSIGKYAFYNCGLTSVTIPNKVTIIGNSVFSDCNSLTSVTIPSSVTSIGEYAFWGCSSLASLSIPNSVTSIGVEAFASSGLTSITIPNSVTSIDNDVFFGCSSLASVTIPNSVTSIGECAFQGCSSLASLSIPNSVTIIGTGAFSDCTNLSTISIGNGITSISESVFENCSSLTSIDIPDNITAIEKESFRGCSELTTLTIPVSVSSIGEYAFRDCTGLTTIFIEAEQLSVGNNSFFDCTSVVDVLCFTDSEKLEWQDSFFPGALGDVEFHVLDKLPYETKFPNARVIFNDCFPKLGINYRIISNTDKTAKVVACSEYKEYKGDVEISSAITINHVTYSVIKIDDEAFLNSSNLTSVTIPNSVTTIGEGAFMYCSGLSSITIPNSVTAIEDWAFSDCTSLTSVTIGNSVVTIGSQAFRGCRELTSVSIPNSVTSIGGDAFMWCRALTTVTMGNRITSIGSQAFLDCSSLTSITIPNGITSIAENTFSGCSSITSLTIPQNVTSIGDYAFSSCSGLESIAIPDNVSSIGIGAFAGCTSLSTLSIGSGITTISESAFRGCTSLSSLTIPNNVTTIGLEAFRGCSGLVSVSIPNSVISIEDAAFLLCDELTTVKVGMKEPFIINNDVFSNCTNATLYVPIGCKKTYAAANNWKLFKVIKEFVEEGSTLPADVIFSGSNHWAGYVADVDLALPIGLEAFIISSVGTTTATASPLDYIPEGVPVLLKRDDLTIDEYSVCLGTGTPPTTNLLKAYNTDKEVYYRDGFILYQDEFVLVNNGILPAGRIFLPANDSGTAYTRSIVIEGDDTTEIEIGPMAIDDSHEVWYDMQGRKLEQEPTKKGLYILNGRKVVVK